MNTSNTHYDIVISGSGLIGSSMAYALSTLPLKIALLEKKPPPDSATGKLRPFDARSISLSYGSQKIFTALKLWQQLIEHATVIEQVHVSDQGKFGTSRMSAAKQGVAALGHMVEADPFNHTLLTACQQQDNITWLCPASLDDFAYHDDHISLAIKQGEHTKTISTKLLIAADGAHSTIRQQCGIENNHWDYQQHALVCNVQLSRPHHNTAYERFTPQGPMAMLPLKGDCAAMVRTVPKELLDEQLGLSDDDFLKALQDEFGYRLGRLQAVSKRFQFPLHMVQAKSHVAKRVALIGNASQSLHPAAGQGFNLGLRDVAVLAQVIAEAIKAEQDIGADKVLRQYQKQRQWDQRRMVYFTDSLTRLFSNNAFPFTPGRNLGMLAFDRIPAMKNTLAKINMGRFGKMPNLACGLELM